MILVQFLIIALAIFALLRNAVSFKENKISFKIFLFWLILWSALIILAFLPDITVIFSKALGVGRGTDVAVYFSIILIFFLLYRTIIRLEKIEYEITQIVRENAFNRKNNSK